MVSRILLILLGITLIISCSENEVIEDAEFKISGDFFDNMLVVGDFRMAGVQDGALSANGQETNFIPIILDHIEAGTLNTIGLINPDIVTEEGFLAEEVFSDLPGKGKVELVYTKKGNSQRPFDRNPALPEVRVADGEELNKSSYDFLDLNNFSFPDLTSASFFDQELVENKYVKAMNFSSIGLLEAINDKNPTLLFLNIGEREILDLALGGGTNNDAKDNMLAQFEENIGKIFNELSSLSCPIVISTIPDVTNFPFFTQSHYNIYIDAAETATLVKF